jgi:hypothetical protein
MTDFDLSKYIYVEYSIAVIIFADVVKMFLSKIDKPFFQYIAKKEPKWTTLFVAIILAILDWLIVSKGQNFHFYQMAISFGVSVLGYDYAWKLLKDAITKKPDLPTDPGAEKPK